MGNELRCVAYHGTIGDETTEMWTLERCGKQVTAMRQHCPTIVCGHNVGTLWTIEPRIVFAGGENLDALEQARYEFLKEHCPELGYTADRHDDPVNDELVTDNLAANQ